MERRPQRLRRFWLACAVTALATQGCSDTDRPIRDAFTESGELIALSGGRARAAYACFTCHGLDGGGNGAGAPRLAGLDFGYLNRQLEGYALGLRRHDEMGYVARLLSADERQKVALHYARLPAPTADARTSPLRAPRLYVAGDANRGLAPCAECHGTLGEGAGAGNPPLAGQPAPYLAAQLDAWRASRRRNDPANLMLDIARRLSPDEIRRLAAYAAALPGEAPRPESPEASP